MENQRLMETVFYGDVDTLVADNAREAALLYGMTSAEPENSALAQRDADKLFEALKREPDVRKERVEAVRNELSDGMLPPDAGELARVMLNWFLS